MLLCLYEIGPSRNCPRRKSHPRPSRRRPQPPESPCWRRETDERVTSSTSPEIAAGSPGHPAPPIRRQPYRKVPPTAAEVGREAGVNGQNEAKHIEHFDKQLSHSSGGGREGGVVGKKRSKHIQRFTRTLLVCAWLRPQKPRHVPTIQYRWSTAKSYNMEGGMWHARVLRR